MKYHSDGDEESKRRHVRAWNVNVLDQDMASSSSSNSSKQKHGDFKIIRVSPAGAGSGSEHNKAPSHQQQQQQQQQGHYENMEETQGGDMEFMRTLHDAYEAATEQRVQDRKELDSLQQVIVLLTHQNTKEMKNVLENIYSQANEGRSVAAALAKAFQDHLRTLMSQHDLRVQDLEANLRSWIKRCEELQRQVQREPSPKKAAAHQGDPIYSLVNNLRSQIDAKTAKLKKLENVIHQLECKIASLKKMKQRREGRKQSEESTLQEHISVLQKQNKELVSEVAICHEQMKAKSSRIKELEQELHRERDRVQYLSKELAKYKSDESQKRRDGPSMPSSDDSRTEIESEARKLEKELRDRIQKISEEFAEYKKKGLGDVSISISPRDQPSGNFKFRNIEYHVTKTLSSPVSGIDIDAAIRMEPSPDSKQSSTRGTPQTTPRTTTKSSSTSSPGRERTPNTRVEKVPHEKASSEKTSPASTPELRELKKRLEAEKTAAEQLITRKKAELMKKLEESREELKNSGVKPLSTIPKLAKDAMEPSKLKQLVRKLDELEEESRNLVNTIGVEKNEQILKLRKELSKQAKAHDTAETTPVTTARSSSDKPHAEKVPLKPKPTTSEHKKQKEAEKLLAEKEQIADLLKNKLEQCHEELKKSEANWFSSEQSVWKLTEEVNKLKSLQESSEENARLSLDKLIAENRNLRHTIEVGEEHILKLQREVTDLETKQRDPPETSPSSEGTTGTQKISSRKAPEIRELKKQYEAEKAVAEGHKAGKTTELVKYKLQQCQDELKTSEMKLFASEKAISKLAEEVKKLKAMQTSGKNKTGENERLKQLVLMLDDVEAENRNLRQTIDVEKEEHILKLQKELDKLKTRLQADWESAKVQELENSNAHKDRFILELRFGLDQANRRASDMETKFNMLYKEWMGEGTKQDGGEEFKHTSGDIEWLRTKLDELEAENRNLRHTVGVEKEEHITKLRREITMLKLKQQEVRDSADLESLIAQKDRTILELRFGHDEANRRASQMESRFDILFSEWMAENTKQIAATYQPLFGSKRGDSDRSTSTVCPKCCHRQDSYQESELQVMVLTMKRVIENLRREVARLKQTGTGDLRYQNLLKQNKELKAKIDVLNFKISSYGGASPHMMVSKLEKETQELSADIQTLTDVNTELIHLVKQAEATYPDFKDKISCKSGSLQYYFGDQSKIQNVLAKQTKELARLQEDLNVKIQQNAFLMYELARCEDELDLLHGKLYVKKVIGSERVTKQLHNVSHPKALKSNTIVTKNEAVPPPNNVQACELRLIDEIEELRLQHLRLTMVCKQYEQMVRAYSNQLQVPFQPLL